MTVVDAEDVTGDSEEDAVVIVPEEIYFLCLREGDAVTSGSIT